MSAREVSVTNGSIAYLLGGLNSGSREGCRALDQGPSWWIQAHTLCSPGGTRVLCVVSQSSCLPHQSVPCRGGLVGGDLAHLCRLPSLLDTTLTNGNSLETRIFQDKHLMV